MDYFKKAIKDVQPAIQFFNKKSKQAFKDIEHRIEQKMHKNQINLEKHLIQISERVYWMPFPSKEQLVPLSKALNEEYGENYFIWNVSEHKYQDFPFNNQVIDHNFPGYPSPPLSQIFLICKAILNWLQMDENNIAIVHCQNTRGRSALILSCLLCLQKNFNHPGEALTYYCKVTKTRDQKILFPSQQLYLNYFANIMNGLKLNNQPAFIHKIILSEIPKIIKNKSNSKGDKLKDDGKFTPYVQVFKESKNIYNSLTQTQIQSYSQNDVTVWFDMKGLEVKEDALLRCKHYQSNETRLPVFRTMIHTNFIHNNVLRLLKKDIDFTNNVEVPDNFFMDIIFIDQKTLQQQKQKQKELEAIEENQKEENQNQENKENSEEESKEEISQNQGQNTQEEEEEKNNNKSSEQEEQNKAEKEDNQLTSLAYIAQSVKQQFGHSDNQKQQQLDQKIQSSLQMQMSRDSSQTSEPDQTIRNPKKNRFSIVDDFTKQKMEESQKNQEQEKPKLLDIIHHSSSQEKTEDSNQNKNEQQNVENEKQQQNSAEKQKDNQQQNNSNIENEKVEDDENEEETENSESSNKIEKNEKIDKFLDELDKDEELEDNEDDMDDYLAQLENEN